MKQAVPNVLFGIAQNRAAARAKISPVSYRGDAANRGNSLRSTGPRTLEGKARSSQNSLRFAFLSNQLLLPDEDPKQLSKLRAGLRDYLKPLGPVEGILVERMVNTLWRLGRVHRIESDLLANGTRRAALKTSENEEPRQSRSPFVEMSDAVAFMTQEDLDAARLRTTSEMTESFLRNADDFVKASQLEGNLDDAFYRALGALQRAQTARRGESSGEKSE